MPTTMTETLRSDPKDANMTNVNSTPGTHQPTHNKPPATSSRFKFAFKLKKSDPTEVSNSHQELLINIEQLDPKAVFRDNNNTIFSPNKIKYLSTRFTYETLPRKHFQLVCVAHEIKTTLSIGELKSNMRELLNSARVTMYLNSDL